MCEPEFEFPMVVDVVWVGVETQLVTGGDVGSEVVDVESVFRDEGVFVDSVLVDFWLGFDGTDFVG